MGLIYRLVLESICSEKDFLVKGFVYRFKDGKKVWLTEFVAGPFVGVY